MAFAGHQRDRSSGPTQRSDGEAQADATTAHGNESGLRCHAIHARCVVGDLQDALGDHRDRRGSGVSVHGFDTHSDCPIDRDASIPHRRDDLDVLDGVLAESFDPLGDRAVGGIGRRRCDCGG